LTKKASNQARLNLKQRLQKVAVKRKRKTYSNLWRKEEPRKVETKRNSHSINHKDVMHHQFMSKANAIIILKESL